MLSFYYIQPGVFKTGLCLDGEKFGVLNVYDASVVIGKIVDLDKMDVRIISRKLNFKRVIKYLLPPMMVELGNKLFQKVLNRFYLFFSF